MDGGENRIINHELDGHAENTQLEITKENIVFIAGSPPCDFRKVCTTYIQDFVCVKGGFQ